MGEACSKPKVDDDDFVTGGKDAQRHAKAALKKTTANELIVIPDAQVVLIASTGEEAPVQAGSFVFLKLEGPRQLCVFFVGGSLEDDDKGFYYPVLPDTPVLLSGDRVLTVLAGEGDVFGIRLPKELPGGKEQFVELVDVISKECALQVQPLPDMADKVAGHIAKGGQKLVSGVEMVAGYMSKGIKKGGSLARSKLAQKPEVKVSETAKATVASARFATGGAVVVADAVLDGLMETASVLGKEVARLGTGNGNGQDGKEGHRESGPLRVGKAAAVSGLQVFGALMKAGDAVLQDTCQETTSVIKHRYGQDAAEVACDGMAVAVDAKNITDLFGRKAVTHLAAKASLYTAKGMIEGAVGGAGKQGASAGKQGPAAQLSAATVAGGRAATK